MRRNASLRAIAAIGLVALVLLLATLFSMRRMLAADPRERVVPQPSQSKFDGERAYEAVRQVVALGPRPSGSEAHAKMRAYLQEQLRAAGIPVREHAFEATTPEGKVPMVNLVAMVAGSRPGVILLGNHYDTKRFSGFPFVGANDGGSTTGWMLEFARTLGPKRHGRSVWLVWFDGEEAFRQWSETDSLYGSRAMVEDLRAKGQLADIHAMINVDMIGDCFLRVLSDAGAPGWMNALLLETANRMGYARHFSSFAQDVMDDHVPFRRAGIPALLVIDFSYGGSIADHRQNWHTARDTIEKVCPASLKAVGDVIWHMLPAVDAQLDANERDAR